MTTESAITARSRALSFLMRRISEARSAGAAKLDPTRVLARECGVSPGTMSAAIRRLVDLQILDAAPGRGIRILAAPGTVAEPCIRGMVSPAWFDCASTIEREITWGVWSREQFLPGKKELMNHFGAGFTTVTRALQHLCDKGLLSRFGRCYHIRRGPTVRSTSTLCVFSLSIRRDELASTTPFAADFWRSLETECEARGLALRVVLFEEVFTSDGGRAAPGRTLENMVHAHGIIGFVVLNLGFDTDSLRRLYRLLSTTALPTAVFDELERIPRETVRRLAGGSPLFRFFFGPGGKEPGIELGRYLASLGHRKGVYFYQDADSVVSTRRIAGLNEGMLSDDAVAPCAVSPGKAIGRQFEDALATAPFGAWLRELNGVQEAMSRFTGSGREQDAHFAHIRRRILSVYSARFTGDLLRHQLRTSPATVWIAESDMLALTLQEYLRRTRDPRGGTPGLVSFDNTIGSFVHDITSYGFNITGLVRAMVAYVTNPRSLPTRRGWAVTVPGRIMPRGSLKAASRSPTTPAHGL